MLNFSKHPHRRYNPLTGEWILVSPHRAKRPWQGQVEKSEKIQKPTYDPECYLCAGNTRASGEVNPDYQDTYAFSNDFSALIPEAPEEETYNKGSLLLAKSEPGICRVICFSADHSLTLPDMEIKAIRKVVDLWLMEYESLGAKEKVNHVQIFENKGQMMGCSNPHPHGQIWGQYSIPQEAQKKQLNQAQYYRVRKKSLLEEYLKIELGEKKRIIHENEDFVALVPFWAKWPFESMIIPRRPIQKLTQMEEREKDNFAEMIKRLTLSYDRLFDTSFPYSAGIHQAPTNGLEYPEWHLHMTFYPPLLRSATVKKFMVGYEMFAEAQRDITPELAAEQLRGAH